VIRVGQETGQTNRLRNSSIFTVKKLAQFDLEFAGCELLEGDHGC
jgi:hypothetical protein